MITSWRFDYYHSEKHQFLLYKFLENTQPNTSKQQTNYAVIAKNNSESPEDAKPSAISASPADTV